MIICDLCWGFYFGEVVLDVLLCVIDVINLCLYLCFVLELCELGKLMIVVLNMVDVVECCGIRIDVVVLE